MEKANLNALVEKLNTDHSLAQRQSVNAIFEFTSKYWNLKEKVAEIDSILTNCLTHHSCSVVDQSVSQITEIFLSGRIETTRGKGFVSFKRPSDISDASHVFPMNSGETPLERITKRELTIFTFPSSRVRISLPPNTKNHIFQEF